MWKWARWFIVHSTHFSLVEKSLEFFCIYLCGLKLWKISITHFWIIINGFRKLLLNSPTKKNLITNEYKKVTKINLNSAIRSRFTAVSKWRRSFFVVVKCTSVCRGKLWTANANKMWENIAEKKKNEQRQHNSKGKTSCEVDSEKGSDEFFFILFCVSRWCLLLVHAGFLPLKIL